LPLNSPEDEMFHRALSKHINCIKENQKKQWSGLWKRRDYVEESLKYIL
jgi:hypothetical protein